MQKIVATFLLLLLTPLATPAASTPYRVGIMLPGDQWASSVDGLKEGMKGLGYVEGRDVRYFLENASGDKKKVEEITRRFVDEKMDMVFTITNTALKVVAEVTRASKLPVVFGSASGPVESGIHPGYATPDTHIAGVTSGSIELVAKRLEILKEVLPRTKKVTIIGDLEADSSKAAFALAQETAAKLGLTLVEFRVKSGEEAIETAKKITRKEADALFLIPSLYAVGAIGEIAAAAKSARLPFAVYQVEHVKINGALLSYGSSYYLQGKQSASLVDKILKGTPPHQLPIERPSLHELILNLDTAKEIGVRFSPAVINRADELIGGGNKR
jgi:putative ABC transport system substrate-binding protein